MFAFVLLCLVASCACFVRLAWEVVSWLCAGVPGAALCFVLSGVPCAAWLVSVAGVRLGSVLGSGSVLLSSGLLLVLWSLLLLSLLLCLVFFVLFCLFLSVLASLLVHLFPCAPPLPPSHALGPLGRDRALS